MNAMRALKLFGALCVGAAAAACEANPSVGVFCTPIQNATATTRGDTVVTTTGLRYRELVVGDGAAAQACTGVLIKTVGRLENGAVFDSTLTGEAGAIVPGLGRLPVQGVEQGVIGMLEGGVRRLIIPPSLAYGSQARTAEPGSGFANIPANSTLIYDITLLQATP
jgi:FKBP-type peptidyl-prolyl cis-trans isomerase